MTQKGKNTPKIIGEYWIGSEKVREEQRKKADHQEGKTDNLAYNDQDSA